MSLIVGTRGVVTAIIFWPKSPLSRLAGAGVLMSVDDAMVIKQNETIVDTYLVSWRHLYSAAAVAVISITVIY